MEKKNGNVNSLTQSYFRSPCLPRRIKLTGSGTEATMFSQLDQNRVISSSWWPSLVLLMFWTAFLSFGEMFDLVYFNYCPSFIFSRFYWNVEKLRKISTPRNFWKLKYKMWLGVDFSNCLEFHWNFPDPSNPKLLCFQN